MNADSRQSNHAPTLRVACVLPQVGCGAAARLMVALLPAFPDLGIEPILVTDHGSDADTVLFTNVPSVHYMGGAGGRGYVRRLGKAIRQLSPDLVFSAEFATNVATARAARRSRRSTPVILRENTSHRTGGNPGAIWRRSARRAYRRADAVVAASRALRRELHDDLDLQWARIVTLPNPVHVAEIGHAAEVARSKPSPASGGPLLVAMGRMTVEKGFDILIDTFASLRTEGVRLAILGEGPERGRLEERARRLGVANRLLLPDFENEFSGWLAHADAFVLSSRSEGFGQAIVEAMAAGTPVIATDCPHGPADLIDNGKNGILVPLGNGLEGRLRDQIDGLLASPDRRRALSEVAAVSAREFESATVAPRYANLFRRVIAERGQSDIVDGRIH